jgi:3-hydroxyacyl-[acyl-carrier-protein] dehydratase
MLLNDLFAIDDWVADSTSARAVIRLNPDHPIFAGHFPGRPIVPGACLLQLLEILVTRASGKDQRLRKANLLKFIVMIDPRVDPTIWVTLSWKEGLVGEWQVAAEGSNGAAVCFKFNAIFQAGSDYAD